MNKKSALISTSLAVSVSKRSARLAVVGVAAWFLSACMVTMNGAQLNDSQLASTKKIAVVSVSADFILFSRAGMLNSTIAPLNVSAWGLDAVYGERFASALTKSLRVPAEVYAGPRLDALKRVYSESYVLNADKFDWKTIAPTVKAIAAETQSDLVAVLLQDGVFDELAPTKHLLSGQGVSAGRQACAAYSNLILVLLDGKTAEPVAGSSLYIPRAPRRVAVPALYCSKQLKGMSDEEAQALRRVLLSMVNEEMAAQTVSRLSKKN
ncbi:MAG: hypothetical protein RLZZ618_4238 [Pseudomonadota bacterium]|jgi:hypothetical protein